MTFEILKLLLLYAQLFWYTIVLHSILSTCFLPFLTQTQVDIHYGMSFVIMNFADEVLCVDGLGKIKAKPLSVVQGTDCILFKVIDLTDITNPGNSSDMV